MKIWLKWAIFRRKSKAKIGKPILALLFRRKLAHFSQIFTPRIKIWLKWFFVKIGQNTKPIALLFLRKLAHFSHFSLYNENLGKWFRSQNWPKYQAYCLTFSRKSKAYRLRYFGQFLTNQIIFWDFHCRFLVKIWKIPSLWALLFREKVRPIGLATFPNSDNEIIFWENDLGVKIGQNTKPIALLFREKVRQ